MPVQGNLEDLTFAELLQGLAASRRTGTLYLYRGKAQGTVALFEGRVADAGLDEDTARLTGEEAFHRLASWTEGRFDFRAGNAPSRTTIAADIASLLMEAARRQDERASLAQKIPAEAVPAFAANLPNRETEFNTHEWTILSKIDGARRVGDIARECGRSLDEVRGMLDGLLAGGIITLDTAEARRIP